MRVGVRGLTVRIGNVTILQPVDLDVEDGEFFALLGPSGCGKTTFLRVLAGLERPASGRVWIGDQVVSDADGVFLPPEARDVGFVFQSYALWPHMTVFENVAFGLRVRPRATRPSRQEIARRVGELLELVQLEWLADRYPSQLSGGQRQRVALARALAIEPRILLLDEPFGALDAKVRKELRRWLRELHKRLGLTSIFVTHDQEEAMELADQVVVMNGGRIEQVGSARDVYARPATPFVYDFLGSSNRLDCVVERGWAVVEGAGIPLPPDVVIDEGAAVLYVRPEDFVLSRGNGSDGLLAEVREVIQSGPLVRIELRTTRQGRRVEVDLPRASSELAGLEPGARVAVRPQAFGIFPASRASEAQAAKEVELAGAPQS